MAYRAHRNARRRASFARRQRELRRDPHRGRPWIDPEEETRRPELERDAFLADPHDDTQPEP